MIKTILLTTSVLVGLFVLLLVFVPTVPEETPVPTATTEVNAKPDQKPIVPYELLSEEDTSYSSCTRKNYNLSVKDDATQDEIRTVLADVYNDKKTLSDKTIIFVYTESQKGAVEEGGALYKGRLFMEPSCDKNNQYKIDFDYWDIGSYTE